MPSFKAKKPDKQTEGFPATSLQVQRSEVATLQPSGLMASLGLPWVLEVLAVTSSMILGGGVPAGARDFSTAHVDVGTSDFQTTATYPQRRLHDGLLPFVVVKLLSESGGPSEPLHHSHRFSHTFHVRPPRSHHMEHKPA